MARRTFDKTWTLKQVGFSSDRRLGIRYYVRGHSQILNFLVRRDPLIAAKSDCASKGICQLLTPNELVWFSRGVKFGEGIGGGVYRLKPRLELSFYLGRFVTVF